MEKGVCNMLKCENSEKEKLWKYLYLVKGELNAHLRSTVFSLTMAQQAFLSAVTYQSNWCSINCVI